VERNSVRVDVSEVLAIPDVTVELLHAADRWRRRGHARLHPQQDQDILNSPVIPEAEAFAEAIRDLPQTSPVAG
jgi:hypothetical protein